MLLLDELRLELEGYRKDMADLYNILNIDKLKEDNAKLQEPVSYTHLTLPTIYSV